MKNLGDNELDRDIYIQYRSIKPLTLALQRPHAQAGRSVTMVKYLVIDAVASKLPPCT